MMYKMIIFDFDGTIADTFNLFYQVAVELSREFGMEDKLNPELIKKYRHQGAAKIIKDFGIKPWQIPKLVKKGQTLFTNKVAEAKPFLEIPEVLEKLNDQTSLGIITTNSAENVEAFLEKHRLDFFDFVISSPALFGKSKTIKNVLKNYNLNKFEVIYVGDEVRDIESARKAGVGVGAVTWGYNDEDLLQLNNPDFLFDIPQELLTLI